eukprot:489281_1
MGNYSDKAQPTATYGLNGTVYDEDIISQLLKFNYIRRHIIYAIDKLDNQYKNDINCIIEQIKKDDIQREEEELLCAQNIIKSKEKKRLQKIEDEKNKLEKEKQKQLEIEIKRKQEIEFYNNAKHMFIDNNKSE